MSIFKKDLYDYSSNIDGYEVCYFRNVCNELIPYPVDGLDYLPIHKGNYYIAKEDIVLYTAAKGEENLCPIAYIVDSKNNKIIPKNPIYKKYKMYYGSRNQFLYKHLDIPNRLSRVILPFVFRSGYNPNNYFVFLNGRLLNSIFYKIIIPSLDNSLVDTKRIYFTRELNANDTLDIFYVSNSSFKRENTSGDLVIKPFKVKATKAIQREFPIPMPYSGYPIDDNSFIVITHGVRLSQDRYEIIRSSMDSSSVILKLTDDEDYLIYGEDLVFIFPYYKAKWETIDDVTKNNYMHFLSLYTKYDIKKDKDNILHFKLPNDKIRLDSTRLYLFEGTSMLSKEDYSIIDKDIIKIHHNIIDYTEYTAVVETDNDQNSVDSSAFIKVVKLAVNTDGQLAVNIPMSIKLPDASFTVFKNGKIIPRNHYSIINGKFIPGQKHNNLQAGDIITIAYAVDGNDTKIAVNFKSYNVTAIRNKEVQIPNESVLDYKDNNIIIFVNGDFLPPSRYKIVENTLKSNEIVMDDTVSIFLAYKTTNALSTPNLNSISHSIDFLELQVEAAKDKQNKFEINYPKSEEMTYYDTPFILFIRGIFVPDSMYRIIKDKTRGDRLFLEFNSITPGFIKKGDILDFVFCSAKDHSNISKLEYHTELTDGAINEVHIPYVYTEVVELSERVMIFYGGTYLDPTRYSINKHNRLLTLYDLPYKDDKERKLTVVFFYTGSSSGGSVSYVPQSGYIKFDEDNMDRNINKNLMMVFVNGLLVPKTDIIDINNSLKKISRDLNTRYDLNILSCSPLVKELKPLYTGKFIRKYNVFVQQSENQLITVYDSSGNPHLSSFTIEKELPITIDIKADFGYKAGNIIVNGSNTEYYRVEEDVYVSASKATKIDTIPVKIIQTENQLIEVHNESNNDNYTSDFEAIPEIKYVVTITSSRDEYEHGQIDGITLGTPITISSPMTLKATPVKIKEIPIEIKDQNLENQNISINVTDAITHETKTYNAPCKIPSVKYGSTIKFFSPKEKDPLYLPAKFIGPFILNKSYIVDYSYPLDNIVADPPTIKSFSNISLHSGSKETLHVDVWSDYLSDKIESYSVTSNADSITKQVLNGSFYKAYVIPDYGYIAGEVMSTSGELVGQITHDIDFSVGDAVTHLPTMNITRDPATPNIYTIKVSMSDGYSDCGPGIYSVRVGTMYECKIILHGEIVNMVSGEMPDHNISIVLLPNEQIRIDDDSTPNESEVDENE